MSQSTDSDPDSGSDPDPTHEPDHELDVREIDGSPFGDIMATLEALDDGERLLLVNSFEPVPLYDVLEAQGFEFESTQQDDEKWHIHIEHAD